MRLRGRASDHQRIAPKQAVVEYTPLAHEVLATELGNGLLGILYSVEEERISSVCAHSDRWRARRFCTRLTLSSAYSTKAKPDISLVSTTVPMGPKRSSVGRKSGGKRKSSDAGCLKADSLQQDVVDYPEGLGTRTEVLPMESAGTRPMYNLLPDIAILGEEKERRKRS